MEEQLIKSETAKLAKEKGCKLELFGKGFEYIDEDGNEYWTSKEKGISGKENTKPVIKCTQSLLKRWLREVHKIHVENRHEGNDTFICRVREGNNIELSFVSKLSERHGFAKVLEEGLQEGLKLIK